MDKWGLLVVYKKTAFLQKDIFVRKLLFYVKILPNNCKKSAILQNYISVKKLLFYVKIPLFNVKKPFLYETYFCKKAAFLCKNPAFLQI